MLHLGRKIEDRTVVSSTPLTSVVAGKFTGRADKKPSCKPVATTSGVVANMALKSTGKSR
jgi:hypothetical protein